MSRRPQLRSAQAAGTDRTRPRSRQRQRHKPGTHPPRGRQSWAAGARPPKSRPASVAGGCMGGGRWAQQAVGVGGARPWGGSAEAAAAAAAAAVAGTAQAHPNPKPTPTHLRVVLEQLAVDELPHLGAGRHRGGDGRWAQHTQAAGRRPRQQRAVARWCTPDRRATRLTSSTTSLRRSNSKASLDTGCALGSRLGWLSPAKYGSASASSVAVGWAGGVVG